MRKVTILLAISTLIATIGSLLLSVFSLGALNFMEGFNAMITSLGTFFNPNTSVANIWLDPSMIGFYIIVGLVAIIIILWLIFICVKGKPAQLLSWLAFLLTAAWSTMFYMMTAQAYGGILSAGIDLYMLFAIVLLGIAIFTAFFLFIFSWVNCFRMPFAENVSYLDDIIPEDEKVKSLAESSMRDEIRDIIASELRNYRMDNELRNSQPQPAPHSGAAINGPLLVQYINTTQPNQPVVVERPVPAPAPAPVPEVKPVEEEKPVCKCECEKEEVKKEEKPAPQVAPAQPIIIPVVMPSKNDYVPPKEQVIVPIILEEKYIDEEGHILEEEPVKEDPVPIVEDKVEEVEVPIVEEVKEEVPAPVVVEEPVAEEPVVEESKNLIIRIPFQERMKTADKSIRDNYNELKNYILSYGVKSRISNSGDTFRLHTKTYVKLTIAGKGLKLYYALDPKDYENTTIPVLDAGHKGIYEEIPLVFKVKSDLSIKRAKQLVDDAMAKDNLVQGEVENIDWAKEFDN